MTNDLLPLLLRFDQLNNEYGKLHKTIFRTSFIFHPSKKKGLDYDSLSHQAQKLINDLNNFRDTFDVACPVQHQMHQPIIDVLMTEILAVGALWSYLNGKWGLQMGNNLSKQEDKNNLSSYYYSYKEYVKEAKKTEKLLSQK